MYGAGDMYSTAKALSFRRAPYGEVTASRCKPAVPHVAPPLFHSRGERVLLCFAIEL